jgi:hypothetical protein
MPSSVKGIKDVCFLVPVKHRKFSRLLRAPRESKAPTPSEHSIWERMDMECGDEVTAFLQRGARFEFL